MLLKVLHHAIMRAILYSVHVFLILFSELKMVAWIEAMTCLR